MGARLQNQLQDGCGPYGRHLTGAVDRQKYYFCGGGSSVPFLLVANTDYLAPIPPPSENIVVSAFKFNVAVGGTTSFIRMALFDMEVFPAGTLLADGGETGTDVAGIHTIAFAAQTLKRNRRYAALFCGRGVVFPQVYTNAIGWSAPSWLGGDIVSPYAIGGEIYTRANGAYPATYNGVYSTVMTAHLLLALTLP